MGWGKLGARLKREYGACETGPNQGGEENRRRCRGEAVWSGSDLCIWRVKLTVINPAGWSVRTVVLAFDWAMIVSLREAAGLCHSPGKETDPEPTTAEVNLSCDGICQGLATHTRGRTDRWEQSGQPAGRG